MAKKKSRKEKGHDDKTSDGKADFGLKKENYEQLEYFDVYSLEKKVTRIFGVKNKQPTSIDPDRSPYIKARTRSKAPYGWTYIRGIDLLSSAHVTRFIQGLLQIAKKLGWKVQHAENIDALKTQLRESEEAIISLEQTNKDWREKHESLMAAFREKQEQILQSRVQEFEQDIKDFKDLLKKAEDQKVPEQDLQEFLYNHPWLFGTEYVNAEPQKLRGAHSRFDFYLERFNKTNDIVEIKLASDSVVNKDGSLSAKVSQAVDQLIEYMEKAQAVAHSAPLSKEEDIRELRPRGIVIIGSDTGPDTKEKLQKWNYQLAHITILTYKDVLGRAESVLKHLKNSDKK